MVISNALGAAVGTPPLHVVIEPTGDPLNRLFGRGRCRAVDAGSRPRTDHAAGHEGAAAAGQVNPSRYRHITPTTKAGR